MKFCKVVCVENGRVKTLKMVRGKVEGVECRESFGEEYTDIFIDGKKYTVRKILRVDEGEYVALHMERESSVIHGIQVMGKAMGQAVVFRALIPSHMLGVEYQFRNLRALD